MFRGKSQGDVMSLSKQRFRYHEVMTGLLLTAGSKACEVRVSDEGRWELQVMMSRP